MWYESVRTIRAAGTGIIYVYINALILMFFVNLLCPGVRAKGGSRLGGHTRGPPPPPWQERTLMACGSALSVSLDTGRSRSRAVSLLTGAHVPHLSFIY